MLILGQTANVSRRHLTISSNSDGRQFNARTGTWLQSLRTSSHYDDPFLQNTCVAGLDPLAFLKSRA